MGDGRVDGGGPAGRYGSAFGGMDALGLSLTNKFLVSITCGIAWLLGIPESRWIVFKTTHTTRDGETFRYKSTWQEGLANGVVNFLLRVVTLGFAGAWIFCRNERFRLAHTTTAEGHRMHFTGQGIEIFLLRLLTPAVVLLTLGLAWPWLVVIKHRWLHAHTVIEDPRAPNGQYCLRFDAGGISYFVEFVVSMLLTVLTLGLYSPWAVASYQRFVWSSTSDTLSPRVTVTSGPRTPAQWVVAIGAGTAAAAVAALVAVLVVFAAVGSLTARFGSANEATDPGSYRETGASPAGEARSNVPYGDSANPGEAPGAVGPTTGSTRTAESDDRAVGAPLADPATNELPVDEDVWLDAPCPAGSFDASRFLTLSAREAYPPSNAVDSNNDTAWAVRDAVPGRDWIEVTLPSAMRVSRVWLTTGYEKLHRRTGDLFPLNDHLRRFTVVTDAGRRTVEVDDETRFADVRLNATTRRVRLVVDEVWPGTRWRDLSISEIQLHCAR